MIEHKLIPLSSTHTGDVFKIVRLNVEGTMRRRLLDLGFVQDAKVFVLQKSPLGDPIAFKVSNTTIALRNTESSKIFGELITHE